MDCQLADQHVAISRPQFATVLAGVRGEVTFDAPLAELTSLRIGGPADVLIVPEDVPTCVGSFVKLLPPASLSWCWAARIF